MTQKRFNTLFICVGVATLLPLLFPVFAIANRARPLVLGLPFNFFWVILWIVIVFIAVSILYAIDPQRRGEGDDD